MAILLQFVQETFKMNYPTDQRDLSPGIFRKMKGRIYTILGRKIGVKGVLGN
jgi:hypothetical protein